MSADMLIGRHARVASAPKRMASNSSRNISTAPGGRDTPSLRYLSAPQSNSTNSMGRFAGLVAACSTLTACGVTSARCRRRNYRDAPPNRHFARECGQGLASSTLVIRWGGRYSSKAHHAPPLQVPGRPTVYTANARRVFALQLVGIVIYAATRLPSSSTNRGQV